MYTPHTVSLISYQGSDPYLTILRGVMLQGSNGRGALRRGEQIEDNVTVYIPFSVKAENPSGEAASFLSPKNYAASIDPEKHWTLQPEGESAGRSGFLVKGELAAPITLEEARDRYDYVYAIAGVTVHDYGSPGMQHYEVFTKVASRYYQYS